VRTVCVGCSKPFATPEKADQHHRQKHAVVKRSPGGTINGRFAKKWPDDTPGLYRDGQRWGDYADLTPQITLADGPKTGVDSAVSGQGTPLHVGLDFRHTACLCACHYGCDCEDQRHGARVPDCDDKKCS
jgi:hypothetical protein